jgi:hypothetical protein
MMETCFGNRQAQVRITVFKKANWFETFVHYIIHNSIKIIQITPFPRKDYFSALYNFPVPFYNYLIIFARIGTPSQSVHSTIFRVADDYEKVEGVVGLAWKSKNPVKIILPDIGSIKNLKKYRKLEDIQEPTEKSSIEEYMQKGNIDTYRKLKSIHRYSVSFWAKIIHDPSNEPWGVIVVDSSEKVVAEKTDDVRLKQYANKLREIINRNYRNI